MNHPRQRTGIVQVGRSDHQWHRYNRNDRWIKGDDGAMSIPELLLLGGGALLLYCAIKGKNPLEVIKGVLTGEAK